MEDEGRVPGSSAFGMLLRRLRLAAGLSQEALAERARMSANGIGALERGYRRTPQRETLALLAGALALDDEQRGEFEATAKRSGLVRRGTTVSVGPWTDTARATLPLALTSFVGREAELGEIATLVHNHRMITLTGTGGIGKTQTALHVATTVSDSATDAVCFVGLASIEHSSSVAAAIASALGVQEVPDHPLLETLLAYLKNKALLLLLDNCEHVIADAASIAETLLAGCPNLRILATSREPLRAAGEHSYRVPSLSVPSLKAIDQLDATTARAYGAAVLFTDRGHAADYRFALTDENAPIVAEICRRLDGIPLAIELAAARVNLLSVKAIAERLDDRFLILTGGDRTALLRQQTMRAAIDWSYDLLAASEQRVFARLSVFAGGCTFAAAELVCRSEETSAADDVFDLLSSLVDKSLVVVDLEVSEPRCRLLDSFREYAREKLVARGERDVVARRHALAYLELAAQLDRVFCYEPDEVVQVQAHEELDNWRAALHWTMTDHGDVLLGQRLVGELCALWQNVAPVEGRRWLVRARELADEQTPASVLARLDYTEATIALVLHQAQVHLVGSRSAVARYRAVGDSLGIALARTREAQALLHLGQVAEAQLALQEALSLARKVDNSWLLGTILRCSGTIGIVDGDIDTARDQIEEALQRYEDLGSKRDVAWAVYDLSLVDYFGARNAELALRHATDALATFRAINHPRGVANTLNVMTIYLTSMARYAEAETNAHEMLNLAREHHLDVLAAFALQRLAAIAALQSHVAAERSPTAYAPAARILGFVDARLAAMGSPRHQHEQPEYDQALVVLRAAIDADALVKLMTEGATMTEEQAVEQALTMQALSAR
ncbi:MAG: helix-turn-helix domain-containing protein [Candidatus Tumulicola sp.]